MPANYKIAVGGGGTGGHAIPALAIVRALRAQLPGLDVLYIGAPDSIEERLAKAEGCRFEAVPIAGIRRTLSAGNLLVPAKCAWALGRALRLVKKFQPQIVIGTGGFSAWPVCQAARLLRIPYLLQEQNAAPGLVTRLLAAGARRIYLGYAEAAALIKARPERTMHTGNPTQLDAAAFAGGDENSAVRSSARKALNLDEKRTTIFITGGSGGARSLNQAADRVKSELMERGFSLIWQTGKQWDALPEATGEFLGRLFVQRFLNRETMNRAYLAADLVVARCGAITLAELAIAGRAAVLVPYPYAAGGHQEANVRAMEAAGAALVILDKDLNAATLLKAVTGVIEPSRRIPMAAAMKALARPSAADVIAGDILKILDRR